MDVCDEATMPPVDNPNPDCTRRAHAPAACVDVERWESDSDSEACADYAADEAGADEEAGTH